MEAGAHYSPVGSSCLTWGSFVVDNAHLYFGPPLENFFISHDLVSLAGSVLANFLARTYSRSEKVGQYPIPHRILQFLLVKVQALQTFVTYPILRIYAPLVPRRDQTIILYLFSGSYL